METTKLKVAGMTCGSCVASVTRALLQVPDVSAVEVDLARGVAMVTTQGAASASEPAMLASLSAVGYEAEPLPASESAAAPQAHDSQNTSGGCGHGSATRQGSGGCCCR